MKSSSALFPVALMRAEVLSSNFIEDTYLLKPNNSPDLTAQVALSRLGYLNQEKSDRGTPVILIHGLFANRSCWLNENLVGFAMSLLEEGYDPWMLEFRGHGDSPVNSQSEKNSLESYAQFDLPAVQAFVKEQTSKSAIWIGHGAGGVAIATAIAGHSIDASDIKGVGLFNTQVSSYPISLYLPIIRSIKKFRSLFMRPISNRKIGPEIEPKGLIKERIRWSGLFTRWKSRKGLSYWKNLEDINVPLIAFSGKKDNQNPPKACQKLALALCEKPEIITLAKNSGYSKDFNYLDSIVGNHAQDEVLPVLIKWIKTLM